MQCACAVLQSSLARPDMPYLSTLSHKRQDFRGKKNTKYTNTCVLSLKVLSKIFFILRTQLDTIMNVRRSSCKVQWDGQADTTKQTVALRNFATFFIQCSLISGKKKTLFSGRPPKFLPAAPLVRQICNKVCGNGVMMMTGKTPAQFRTGHHKSHVGSNYGLRG